MNYKDVLSRAWRYTWENKSLWILGFFAGGATYLILPFYMLFVENGFLNNYNERLMEYAYPTSEHALEALPHLPLPMLLAILVILLVLLLAFSVVQIAADIGLIYGGAIADSNMKPKASHSWRKGFANFWRALGTSLVASLPLAILLFAYIAAIIAALAPLFGSLFSDNIEAAPFIGTIFSSLGIMLVAVIAYEILSVLVTLFTSAWSSLALSAVVLEHRGVGSSLSRGWRLIKSRFGTVLLIAILSYGVAWVFGIALNIFILPLVFASALESLFWLQLAIALIGALFGCATGTLMTIFIRNFWTISFRRLQAMDLAESSAPAPVPAPPTTPPLA